MKQISLSRNGTATADIIIGKSPSEPVKHAAKELAKFLKQITGASFGIAQEPGGKESHILVGPCAAEFAGVIIRFKPDEIYLRTSGNFLILNGGGSRGTLYAVFTFLEDHLGCRWWTSSASTIPSRPTLTIPALNVRYASPLEYRYSFWTDAHDPDWAVRNKSNGPQKLNGPEYGGYLTHGGVHSFFRLIPPEKYFKRHPEWFSLLNGRRKHFRTQLCLTNKEMQKELIKNLKKEFKKQPNHKVYSVSQNDVWYEWLGLTSNNEDISAFDERWGHCQCEKCKALNKKAGSPAGSLLHFVNSVAKDIEKEYPDKLISTIAYQYTRKAPKNIRPRRNVIIQLCTIECSFSVPLTHDRNGAFRDDIIAWSKLTDRLYIWDYTTNFRHYLIPHPNLRVLGPNIRFFAKNNVKGVFEQGATPTRGAEFAELRAWVLAKLLWNPSLDDQKLIKEFCVAYYGPAAKAILAYQKLIHDSVEKSGEYTGCFTEPPQVYLSLEVLTKAWKLIQEAERSVRNDPVFLKRFYSVQASVMYAFLCQWNALCSQCIASNAKWPLPRSIKPVAERFKQLARITKVTQVKEAIDGFNIIDGYVKSAG